MELRGARYARYSTDRQTDNSIKYQLQKLKSIARKIKSLLWRLTVTRQSLASTQTERLPHYGCGGHTARI